MAAIDLCWEQWRTLSAPQECRLLREAAAQRALPPAARLRLAALLNQLDAFGETIAVLEAIPPHSRSPSEQALLIEAWFGRRDAGDLERALENARKAGLPVEEGRALLALGEQEQGEACLREVLRRDPGDVAALRRLGVHLLRGGEVAAALSLTAGLLAGGVRHAQLLSLRAAALAAGGSTQQARDLLGLEQFTAELSLPLPPEWNAALAGELLASHALRERRHGVASVATWRIDSLTAGSGPLARHLCGAILDVIRTYCAALPDSSHPWLGARPAAAQVRAWCVITGGDGHERWHMHPYGWMSGVFYVAVPGEVEAGESAAGCLEVGLDDLLIPPESSVAVGSRLVRPRAGKAVLFPSHCSHRTFPHASPGRRIAVAFDVVPT